ncbi:MAG: PHP domain-containing protein [Ferruginibacter sp.]
MDNYQIADNFSLLAKLMDIHGENSFKSKSYSSAAFAIEKLTIQLAEIPLPKIASIKGVGSSCSQKIEELLNTGELKILNELILSTPPGIIEMLNIKGIGPKKINTIWKEMEIETVGELLYACDENRLKLYKGFGEKTQQNISDSIQFYIKTKGSHTYAQADKVVVQLQSFLSGLFEGRKINVTGSYYRQLEMVDELEFVLEASIPEIESKLSGEASVQLAEQTEHWIRYNNSMGIIFKIHSAGPENFANTVVYTSASDEFLEALAETGLQEEAMDEMDFFSQRNLHYIPAKLREKAGIIQIAKSTPINGWIEVEDIKGLIHCHSNWSDGSNTIEEMAQACKEQGLEYMVISDHSKSAFYAQGLFEDKIIAQHAYIDELNTKLSPFKIFKSIESDILNDGRLDYNNTVLSTFDLVIASIHSNLKMTEEKAMSRLLTAIENPYTTILGHMTGRLLLGRPPYPVDHKKIIDACAENNVVIELNANPNRLDIDWRFIDYALDKGVLISIDPDAHFIHGINDIRYGVLAAQKAFVKKEHNLSSFTLVAFEKILEERKLSKGI